MTDYTEAEHRRAGERIMADLERVPVWKVRTAAGGGYRIDGEPSAYGVIGHARTLRAAAVLAAKRAAFKGLPEPVLVLPDGTQISASDFLAREGGK